MVVVLSALAWAMMIDMAAMTSVMSGDTEALGPGMPLIEGLLSIWHGEPMHGEGAMSDGMMMSYEESWSTGYLIMMFIMWQIMMVAMMLPTSIPMLSTYADIRAAARAKGEATASSWFFGLAYMGVWAFAAGILVLGQWFATLAFGSVEVLAARAPGIAGVMMIIAGLYQWTTIKDVCLVHCQSPMQFILSHWREGTFGAIRMGAHHGLFCLGCCWAYMLLMFVAGTMNLVWMLAITAVMVIEKIVPGGNLFSRIVGTGLVIGGGALVFEYFM